MNNCAICNQPMKLIPAGISKSTGKPYNSFYACEDRTHKQPKGTPAPTPVQNFSASLDQQAEDRKWKEIGRGKVRHGFAVEAFKLKMPLNVATASQINMWTDFVMSGKLLNAEELIINLEEQMEDIPFNQYE